MSLVDILITLASRPDPATGNLPSQRTAQLATFMILTALVVTSSGGFDARCEGADANVKEPDSEVHSAGWASFQNAGRLALPPDDLPLTWSPDEGIAWQVEIAGYGQSSPVIVDGQVVVTSTSGLMKDHYHLAAFDLETGETRWKVDFANPSPVENTSYVSRAAPTPAADQHGVIAMFEGGLVVAVDHQGGLRWQRNLVAEFGAIEARHGLASSLEQDEKRVFAWIERTGEPYLMAIDKQAGKTVWKVPGLEASTWSTPRLVPTEWGPHLVCSASGRLVGFDPESGARLWELTDLANNTSATPVPVSPGSFLIGASDGRGEESSSRGASSNGLVEITRSEAGEYAAAYVWRSEKATCSFGSPIVVGTHAYLVNRAGVLFTLDLASGEQLSSERLGSGSIWATPIAIRNKIYYFGQKGTTSVIADGNELATNRLWDATQPTSDAPHEDSGPPSASGSVLYAAAASPPWLVLRRGDRLYGLTSQASEASLRSPAK